MIKSFQLSVVSVSTTCETYIEMFVGRLVSQGWLVKPLLPNGQLYVGSVKENWPAHILLEISCSVPDAIDSSCGAVAAHTMKIMNSIGMKCFSLWVTEPTRGFFYGGNINTIDDNETTQTPERVVH